MQLGIFAKTFEGTRPEIILPHVKAAGFSVAQYNFACSGLSSMPQAVPTSVIRDIQTAVAESEVKLVALSATYNMIHPDVSKRADGLKRLAVVAEAAQALSIPMITLCTGTRDAEDQWRHHADNNTAAAWDDLLTEMVAALSIADRFQVDLGIEPELANVVNSTGQARRLIDALKSPRVKIVFDPANLFETEGLNAQRRIIAEGIETLADCIAMVHAKDRLADGRFVAAGKGVLDYPHFLSELRQVGFSGSMITHGLSAAEAPVVSDFLKREMHRAGFEAAP